ncbi:MAG: hypothetical protein NZ518_02275 [Dehalococcoidia bacterium]|nr:hypothetical protein [Dehalococcoidia bacterium]
MNDNDVLSCGHPVGDLHALVDRALSPDERRAVEARLLECAECRSAFAAAREVARALESIPLESPPPLFTARVMARVRQSERRRAPLRTLIAAAAAVVIVFGLSLSFAPTSSSADVVAEPTAVKPEIVVTLPDPSDLSLDLDTSVVIGLGVALVASAFLLRELVRVREA